MKIFSFIFVLLLFVSVTAFAEENVREVPAFSDSTNPIKVAVGENFSIVLESNQTTGYKWQFSKSINTTILEFQGSEYEADDTGMVGAGGEEIWYFKAIAPGMTMIVLKYVRPWEKDMYPLESKTFIINVE